MGATQKYTRIYLVSLLFIISYIKRLHFMTLHFMTAEAGICLDPRFRGDDNKEDD